MLLQEIDGGHVDAIWGSRLQERSMSLPDCPSYAYMDIEAR